MVVLKPDLVAAGGLPPLPQIQDDNVRLQVFTHRSVFARSRHDFEDLPNDPAPDNEALEHLGDAVLGLVITGLVRECYRHLRVGPATKIRALVVGNATLADISVKYGLPQRLRLHRAQAITLRASVNIQADAFEAYIGGLYVDRGIDVVSDWINILFLPYVKEAYRIVRAQYGLLPQPETMPISPPPSPDFPSAADVYRSSSWVSSSPGLNQGSSLENGPATNLDSGGHLSLFNQFVQQKHKSVEWVYESVKDEGTKVTPLWVVRANIDGRPLSVGRGNTKKAAQNDAAREGLVKLGVAVTSE